MSAHPDTAARKEDSMKDVASPSGLEASLEEPFDIEVNPPQEPAEDR